MHFLKSLILFLFSLCSIFSLTKATSLTSEGLVELQLRRHLNRAQFANSSSLSNSLSFKDDDKPKKLSVVATLRDWRCDIPDNTFTLLIDQADIEVDDDESVLLKLSEASSYFTEVVPSDVRFMYFKKIKKNQFEPRWIETRALQRPDASSILIFPKDDVKFDYGAAIIISNVHTRPVEITATAHTFSTLNEAGTKEKYTTTFDPVLQCGSRNSLFRYLPFAEITSGDFSTHEPVRYDLTVELSDSVASGSKFIFTLPASEFPTSAIILDFVKKEGETMNREIDKDKLDGFSVIIDKNVELEANSILTFEYTVERVDSDPPAVIKSTPIGSLVIEPPTTLSPNLIVDSSLGTDVIVQYPYPAAKQPYFGITAAFFHPDRGFTSGYDEKQRANFLSVFVNHMKKELDVLFDKATCEIVQHFVDPVNRGLIRLRIACSGMISPEPFMSAFQEVQDDMAVELYKYIKAPVYFEGVIENVDTQCLERSIDGKRTVCGTSEQFDCGNFACLDTAACSVDKECVSGNCGSDGICKKSRDRLLGLWIALSVAAALCLIALAVFMIRKKGMMRRESRDEVQNPNGYDQLNEF